jgi:formylglycine-generating enzyme required for sulfatase activity
LASAEAPAAPQPGLVAEKPAEGPFVAVQGGYMVAYSTTIPGTDATFEMIPIAGGEVLMGSPDGEADRSPDEGPQVRVRVAPMWVGKCEVTWAEYKAFMAMYDVFKKFQALSADHDAKPGDDRPGSAAEEGWDLVEAHVWDGNMERLLDVDVVTSPTPLYDKDTTFMSGEEPDLPAVTMTHFAARQYTKWLSGVTGCEYRLPSEAEWEYAARAGATTTFSFGDDAAELAKHGWFDENSDYAAHPVAQKEPNAWGLYDVHGNAAEWTLEEYRENRYAEVAPGPVDAGEIILWPTKVFPQAIRGGSWLDTADRCRSAARQKSEEAEWKLSDPNRPLSPWWYTEEPAMGVGMRLVRPLAPMSPETRRRAWDAEVEYIRNEVVLRLKEGRGVLGVADQSLPAAVEAAEKLSEPQAE